jgi:DNA-binding transcriptional ArsR family regulator
MSSADELPEFFEFDDIATMDALANPIRLKLLDVFRTPSTVKDAAEALEVPVTRLYHHVNTMVEHGLLVVAEERQKGSLTERLFRVAAGSIRPSAAFFEHYGREGQAEVIRLAFRMGENEMTEAVGGGELVHGLGGVPSDKRSTIALTTLRLEAADLAELIDELGEVLARYGEKDGPISVGFFHAVYPRVTRG